MLCLDLTWFSCHVQTLTAVEKTPNMDKYLMQPNFTTPELSL